MTVRRVIPASDPTLSADLRTQRQRESPDTPDYRNSEDTRRDDREKSRDRSVGRFTTNVCHGLWTSVVGRLGLSARHLPQDSQNFAVIDDDRAYLCLGIGPCHP